MLSVLVSIVRCVRVVDVRLSELVRIGDPNGDVGLGRSRCGGVVIRGTLVGMIVCRDTANGISCRSWRFVS